MKIYRGEGERKMSKVESKKDLDGKSKKMIRFQCNSRFHKYILLPNPKDSKSFLEEFFKIVEIKA